MRSNTAGGQGVSREGSTVKKQKKTKRGLNGVQSQSTLISINTKNGKAENVSDNKDYIYVDNSQSDARKVLSAEKLNES